MDYPEAAGFALAQDRFLAQGGQMKKPKRGMIGEVFTKGALKGKTIDQANMIARAKWSKASQQLRDGYANSARRGMMSPSELAADAKRQREATSRSQSTRSPLTRPTTNASLNAALPGETATQMYERQRQERTAKPPAVPQLPLTRPTGTATNDENARAQAMLNEALGSDRYATADNGDAGMRAAVAMRSDDPQSPDYEPRPKYSEAERDKARTDAAKMIADQGGYEVKRQPPKGILASAASDVIGMNQSGFRMIKGLAEDSVKMNQKGITTAASLIPGQTGQAVRRELKSQNPGEPGYVAPKPTPSPVTPIPAPAQASQATPSAPVPNFGVPPMLARPDAAAAAAPTGAGQSQKINRLTGLPFGYQPGDAVDTAQQGAADASVARQQAGPLQKPDPGAYAAAGRTMQRDAVVGAKYRAPAAPVVKAPQLRPGVTFNPAKGYVADPKAKPTLVKPGDVSLDQYQTARTRMRSAGSTSEQDKNDQALLAKFGRQTLGY
jgi:hypothetical protein